ncbi:hypothetical protein FHS29_006229 [Saccharothrix tamanrassetensis]|uniref:HEXXH motif domain-containing protein n=1 Tax=Saccharothrix tamanrassetensis TaxID=1051531 RepID=A0A841CTZ4_9PSEU|nr:HEXXH motif-containing putative peptide modification protein [Saccharothrix tamanrassetensis]MBB5959608.1 hypothetical protein [Saccharothrix tamanrassetensis]
MPVVADGVVAVERELAGHPEFGDAGLIALKAVEFYRFALELLSERSAAVAGLLAGIRGPDGEVPTGVAEDPLVRVTLDEAVSRLERGVLDEGAWSEVVTMLRLVGDALDAHGTAASPTGAELSGGHAVRVAPGRRVWLCGPGDERTGPLGRTFLAAFDRDFLRGVPGDLLPPSARAVRELEAGFAALCALLPELGPGIGAHYTGLGEVDVRTEGETFLAGNVGRIPGVVFFSPDRTSRPWRLAESALHEGLHLKLFDIQRSASVFEEPDRLPDGPKVKVPWLKWSSAVAPNEWALDRALGAFHVYAHEVLFDAAVRTRLTPELVERFGAPEPGDRASLYRVAPERATYLGEQLLGEVGAALTDHGREFVTWLLGAARAAADA